MNFASDNVYGVHPKILAALAHVNDGTAPSYGGDEQTTRAEDKLKEVFGCDLRAFLVTSGTAANGLAPRSSGCMAPPARSRRPRWKRR